MQLLLPKCLWHTEAGTQANKANEVAGDLPSGPGKEQCRKAGHGGAAVGAGRGAAGETTNDVPGAGGGYQAIKSLGSSVRLVGFKCLYAGLAEVHEEDFEPGEEDCLPSARHSPESGCLHARALGQASCLPPWLLVQCADHRAHGRHPQAGASFLTLFSELFTSFFSSSPYLLKCSPQGTGPSPPVGLCFVPEHLIFG